MIVALVFYGALATLALWATWKDEDLRWIGWTLAVGFCLSNLLYFIAPVTARPGPYAMVETMVALFAYCAWRIFRYRLLVLLVTFNLISLGVTINFAATGLNPTKYEIMVFVVGTNICFAVECIITLSVGIAHGYRTGRFHRKFPLRWRAPQPNVAREGERG